MTRPRGLAGDAVMTGGASLVATALGALASILIARELGVAARGDWAVISSLAVLIATFASIGLPVAAAYGAGRTMGAERARVVRAALTAALVLGALAALVYAAIAAVTRPGSSSMGVLMIGAAIAAAALWLAVVVQLLLTTVPLRWFAGLQVIPNALMLAAIGALALLGEVSVAAVATVSAATAATGAGIGVAVLARHRLAGLEPRAARILRPYVAFALLTFGVIAMTQVVQRVDILIVEGFKGSRDAGLYAVAVQMGELLLIVPVALGHLMFRRGATAAEGHWDDLLRALRWTAVLGVSAALVLVAAAPQVVEFVFGTAYADSATAVRWLAPGVVVLGLQSVVSNYVAARGRPRAVFYAWTTAGVLAIGLNLLVVPRYGVNGAAAVSSLSYFAVLGLHVRPLLSVRP